MITKKEAKMIYKVVGFSLIALCFVLSFVYRPYAYSHHLNDFHLADSYTSFSASLLASVSRKHIAQKVGQLRRTSCM